MCKIKILFCKYFENIIYEIQKVFNNNSIENQIIENVDISDSTIY